MPLATVLATATDKNAPMRFKMPANATAVFGFNAPVAIDVAIAFAVSWKPFVKSKNSATTIIRTRRIVMLTSWHYAP